MRTCPHTHTHPSRVSRKILGQVPACAAPLLMPGATACLLQAEAPDFSPLQSLYPPQPEGPSLGRIPGMLPGGAPPGIRPGSLDFPGPAFITLPQKQAQGTWTLPTARTLICPNSCRNGKAVPPVSSHPPGSP